MELQEIELLDIVKGDGEPGREITRLLNAEEYRILVAMRKNPLVANQAWAILTEPGSLPVSRVTPDATK